MPDALARGEQLYRDVVYWFGPFTPHFQAAFLRVFGSGFGGLVAAGAVAAAAALALLHVVLRRVTGRVRGARDRPRRPTLVFMPNAGGPLLGMGYRIWHAAVFALAAVAFASATGWTRWSPALAGACAGLAGLCRTEWGLASAAAAAGRSSRTRDRRRGLIDAAVSSAAAVAVFAAGLGHFLAAGG